VRWSAGAGAQKAPLASCRAQRGTLWLSLAARSTFRARSRAARPPESKQRSRAALLRNQFTRVFNRRTRSAKSSRRALASPIQPAIRRFTAAGTATGDCKGGPKNLKWGDRQGVPRGCFLRQAPSSQIRKSKARFVKGIEFCT
jgi:hypothetical protein